MVVVLKLMSFAIWFIIMLFIIGAAIYRKRPSLTNHTLFPPGHIETGSTTSRDHQQS